MLYYSYTVWCYRILGMHTLYSPGFFQFVAKHDFQEILLRKWYLLFTKRGLFGGDDMYMKNENPTS